MNSTNPKCYQYYRMAAIFVWISVPLDTLFPNMLDMRFLCEAIIKDDTKEFCLWNSFHLLATLNMLDTSFLSEVINKDGTTRNFVSETSLIC